MKNGTVGKFSGTTGADRALPIPAGAGYGSVSPCGSAPDRRPGEFGPTDQFLGEDKTIVVVAQREARVDAPQPSDLYTVGTLAVVHKVVKMPNQNLFVFAEGWNGFGWLNLLS